MKKVTPQLFILEVKKAFVSTFGDAVIFLICAVVGCLAIFLMFSFLGLPTLMAKYFGVLPEFTDYTLFQNWLSISQCMWLAFWLVTANRVDIKLDVYKKGKTEC